MSVGWETVPTGEGGAIQSTMRLKVPGGWLVLAHAQPHGPMEGVAMTFLPDPEHQWQDPEWDKPHLGRLTGVYAR